MQRVVLGVAFGFLLVAACGDDGGSGPGPDAPERPALPQICEGRCISDEPVNGLEDCCDSVTCWFDEDANEWRHVFCDPPTHPCDECTPDQQCVQSFDGTCNTTTACVERTVDCPDNACSTECEAAYCPAPYQCQNRPPCGTGSPLAFTCYGP